MQLLDQRPWLTCDLQVMSCSKRSEQHQSSLSLDLRSPRHTPHPHICTMHTPCTHITHVYTDHVYTRTHTMYVYTCVNYTHHTYTLCILHAPPHQCLHSLHTCTQAMFIPHIHSTCAHAYACQSHMCARTMCAMHTYHTYVHTHTHILYIRATHMHTHHTCTTQAN